MPAAQDNRTCMTSVPTPQPGANGSPHPAPQEPVTSSGARFWALPQFPTAALKTVVGEQYANSA